MSDVREAFCEQLNDIVTIDRARREYLALEKPPKRFHFLCSTVDCRNQGIRIVGAGYKHSAEDVAKFRAAYFRRHPTDQHLPHCQYVTGESMATEQLPGESDEEFKRRQARRKLHDFVDEFDPRGEGESKGGLDARSDHDEGASAVNKRSRNLPAAAPRPGITTTRYLDSLVDSYLEARARLSVEHFRSMEVSIKGQGRIRLTHYFRTLKSMPLDTAGRVIYGGARFDDWYGRGPVRGFLLRFMDRVAQCMVTLYVAPTALADYRFRNILLRPVEKAAANQDTGYLTVFALGVLHHDVKRKQVNLIVDDLRHLAILFKPKNGQSADPGAAPNADSSAQTT